VRVRTGNLDPGAHIRVVQAEVTVVARASVFIPAPAYRGLLVVKQALGVEGCRSSDENFAACMGERSLTRSPKLNSPSSIRINIGDQARGLARYPAAPLD
jgi:hypothetical protein